MPRSQTWLNYTIENNKLKFWNFKMHVEKYVLNIKIVTIPSLYILKIVCLRILNVAVKLKQKRSLKLLYLMILKILK